MLRGRCNANGVLAQALIVTNNFIISAKEKFMNSDNPIISVDTKKKEQVGGNLHRDGRVYCTQAIEVSDHDYAYLADLKIAPHGIYDMKQNKAHINIGTSLKQQNLFVIH